MTDALKKLEQALALLHSLQTLEGTDKDELERLIESAVADLEGRR